MRKHISAFLFAIICYISSYAQQDTTTNDSSQAKHGHLHTRISLITVGPGEKVWEALGHVCIRVIDSTKTGDHRDVVYNYGTFDNRDEDFGKKLVDGTLPYYLAVFPSDFLLNTFIETGRSLEEQVLVLNDEQKEQLLSRLENNSLPKNKYYQYHFFTDNCCTPVRDIFPEVFGSKFQYGKILGDQSKLTFRELLNIHLSEDNWYRAGANILLGYGADKVMTNEDAMFLPYYLEKGVRGARMNGNKFAEDPIVISQAFPNQQSNFDGPLVLTCVLTLLTVAGLTYPKLRLVGNILSTLIMTVTGILGCIILFAWFGTEHIAFKNNLNVLWLLPTNLIVPFLNARSKGKYGLIAMLLLGLSLLFHILRIQQLFLFDLSPLYFALLLIYLAFYKKSVQ